MSERDIEREEIEVVFGLTGGELNTDSFGPFKYNYDGPPEWTKGQRGQFHDWHSVDYMTGIHYGLFTPPPDCFEHEGTLRGLVYQKVASFASSGEAECLCNDVETADLDGDCCSVCENEYDSSNRGYVYIGDGWSEVVYCGMPLHVLDTVAGQR